MYNFAHHHKEVQGQCLLYPCLLGAPPLLSQLDKDSSISSLCFFVFLAALGSLMIFPDVSVSFQMCLSTLVLKHLDLQRMFIKTSSKPLYFISSCHYFQFQQSPYNHIALLLHYLHQVWEHKNSYCIYITAIFRNSDNARLQPAGN